jgi:hypothetical protein
LETTLCDVSTACLSNPQFAVNMLLTARSPVALGYIRNEKIFLNNPLAKPKWNAEVFMKTYVMFIHGDVPFIALIIHFAKMR